MKVCLMLKNSWKDDNLDSKIALYNTHTPILGNEIYNERRGQISFVHMFWTYKLSLEFKVWHEKDNLF